MALCPLWENIWHAYTRVHLVLRGSPGASIVGIRTAVNSVTPTSYDGLKGSVELISIRPSLRVVLSLHQLSDNVMILIEEAWKLRGLK